MGIAIRKAALWNSGIAEFSHCDQSALCGQWRKQKMSKENATQNEQPAQPEAKKLSVFQQTVKSQINGDKKHGWGVEDSLEVIIALIAEETGATVADLKEASAKLIEEIRLVVNPSQFRQRLETAGSLEKTEVKRNKTLKGVLDGLGD